MIVPEEVWGLESELAADFVIVGAGAAGIGLALELEKLGCSSLLLEGGNINYSDTSQDCYSGESIGVPLPYGLKGSRFRFAGGSTNCWAGGCGELDDEDFEFREWVNHSGWPISKREMLPWYQKTSDFFQIVSSPSSPNEQTHEFRDLPNLETRCLTYTSVVRFNQEFQSHLSKSEKIQLLLNANCTGLPTNSIKSQIQGIEINSFNKSHSLVKGKSYVLACGGIENARILLNAYEQKAHNLPRNINTGRFFSDHPIAPSATVIPFSESNSEPRYDLDWFYNKYNNQNPKNSSLRLPFYKIPLSIQKSEGILNGAIQFDLQEAELSTSAVSAWRISNWIKGNSSDLELKDIKEVISDPLSILNAARNKRGSSRLAMRFQIEQAPNPDSYVSLSEERDNLGLKRTKLNWQFTSLERKTIDVINHYIAKNLNSSGFGLLQLDNNILRDNMSLPSDLRGGQHHSGTTRMAHSKESGVVDKNLKVFDVDNLYIVGSSVFPTNGWVNPTFSIVALGFRLAHHLNSMAAKS